MSQEVYLTKEGHQKLVEELERLKTTERRKFSKAIGEARLQGDISENAEYDAAKEAQGHNEARIAELELKLARARIIDKESIPTDRVYIGAVVTLEDLDTAEEMTYTLVSSEEADYDQGKISITSPVGKSLMGKQAGEKVSIEVPAGTLNYKIMKIER
ncbi:MAG: transcription elongation factor GreA [Candidatus Omnitrophota bacterium]